MTQALVQPRMTMPLDQLGNQELARRARAGSRSCFEELVGRFQVPLLRFLMRRTPGRADAEDLVQETFLRAYASMEQYSEKWPIHTWLFTIAHRLAINHTRGLAVRGRMRLVREVETGGERPEERAEKAEEAGSLWKVAKELLSEDQYTALWLFYVEEMAPGEISRVLDRSWVAVKTMLHRARRRLLPHVGHLGPESSRRAR